MSASPFRQRIRASIADDNLQIALDGNARRRMDGRLKAIASLPDFQERRQRAHAIKAAVVADLDAVLERFIQTVSANGITVHRAQDAAAAMRIFLEICDRSGAQRVAKSKSMVSEEINFNHALAAHGIQSVETDLGEYIVQLRGERPSHILTPAVHLRREQVGQLFHEQFGVPYTEDIPEMVATARRHLRRIFLEADIGVSGVNFGVAESGTLCMVTNEGNGRMVTSLPPVHVALMGMERLVPTLDDLALFLSLLPRSATGQRLSVYTSLIHAPRGAADLDGPQERHLIIVDNGRSAVRSSSLAESLYCLRCGACLNVCPVFREIGGHAYVGGDGSPAPYPGPIGSVISPALAGCENFGHLAQASSLCGVCKEACPVDIDLPKLLLRIRAGDSPSGEKRVPGRGLPAALRTGLKGFRLAAESPLLFSLSQRLGGLASRLLSPRAAYMRLPGFTGWGASKDFPRMAVRPFRARWHAIHQDVAEPRAVGNFVPAASLQPVPPVVDIAEKFVEVAGLSGAHVRRVSASELPGALAALLASSGAAQICAAELGPEIERALAAAGVGLVHQADPGLRVGVTLASAGVAETGSLLLLSGPGRSLLVSLLPDVHISILRAADLVPTLEKALRLPALRQSAAAVFVTGPSRTSDIEMALTTGVHGPKEEHIFLMG